MNWIKQHLVGLAFAAFIAASVLLFIWALSTKSTCPPKQQVTWAIQGKEYPGWNKYDPKESVYTASQEETTKARDYRASDSYGKVLETWFCEEAKLTDFALVIFTFCLVVVGGLTMWTVDATAKRTERAYVFGGPGNRLHNSDPDNVGPQRPDIGVTMANYGKTTAFIISIQWGQCAEDDWPQKKLLKPPNSLPHEDVFFPEMHKVQAMPVQITPRSDAPIFYGVIYYRDVFKELHKSKWRHKVVWNDGDWETKPLEGNATDWD